MSSEKIRIGIDIGSNGAVAVFLNGKLKEHFVLPKIEDGSKDEGALDIKTLVDRLMTICQDTTDVFVVLEDLHSVYGSSAGSNFTFGWNCGATEAIVATLGLPYATVAPKKWQKEMWREVDVIIDPVMYKNEDGVKVQKVNKKGKPITKVDTKGTSLAAAKLIWPEERFLKSKRAFTPHDGIVDACLLGEYANRKY